MMRVWMTCQSQQSNPDRISTSGNCKITVHSGERAFAGTVSWQGSRITGWLREDNRQNQGIPDGSVLSLGLGATRWIHRKRHPYPRGPVDAPSGRDRPQRDTQIQLSEIRPDATQVASPRTRDQYMGPRAHILRVPNAALRLSHTRRATGCP